MNACIYISGQLSSTSQQHSIVNNLLKTELLNSEGIRNTVTLKTDHSKLSKETIEQKFIARYSRHNILMLRFLDILNMDSAGPREFCQHQDNNPRSITPKENNFLGSQTPGQ